jgi:hypothetical protein
MRGGEEHGAEGIVEIYPNPPSGCNLKTALGSRLRQGSGLAGRPRPIHDSPITIHLFASRIPPLQL